MAMSAHDLQSDVTCCCMQGHEQLQAAAVLELPGPELLACGLSRQKQAYITDLAQRFHTGTLETRSIVGASQSITTLPPSDCSCNAALNGMVMWVKVSQSGRLWCPLSCSWPLTFLCMRALHALMTWQKAQCCIDPLQQLLSSGSASHSVPHAAMGDEELYEVLTAVKGIGEINKTSEPPALAVTTSLSHWQAQLLW